MKSTRISIVKVVNKVVPEVFLKSVDSVKNLLSSVEIFKRHVQAAPKFY